MVRRALRKVVAGTTVLAVLACGGFAADVSGTTLTVDGAPWTVVTCESGEALGFAGVELTGEDGRRLRLQPQLDGQLAVVMMPADGVTGTQLGVCGTGAFHQTGLTINDVTALEGTAELACKGEPSVEGSVRFGRCATPLLKNME
jgi:hypothetical protein